MIGAFARLKDPDLAGWIEEHVAVPQLHGRPDHPGHHRRTTATQLAAEFGVEDGWPVVCEPFTQWALEDRFPTGRPPFEDAGVQLVARRRALRADEAAAAQRQPPGAVLPRLPGRLPLRPRGVQDPLFTGFLLGYMDDEATPTLRAGARRRPRRLQARAHRAVRQPRDQRHPGAAVRGELRPDPQVAGAGDPHNARRRRRGRRSALVVAAWASYAEGVDEQGEPIEVVDRRKDAVMARGRGSSGDDPLAFLRDPDLFGDLVEDERFTAEYTAALDVAARATVRGRPWRRGSRTRDARDRPGARSRAARQQHGVGTSTRTSPTPGHGQVLLAMKASSICGSDIRAIYREHLGHGPEAYQGVIAGHEPCGEVVAVGPGCSRLEVGDRVVVYHIVGLRALRRVPPRLPDRLHSRSRARRTAGSATAATPTSCWPRRTPACRCPTP